MINIFYIDQLYKLAKEWFPFPAIVVVTMIIGTTIVIRNRKKMIGFATRFGSYLHYMAVDKRYQGRGYGKKMFKQMLPKIDRLRVDLDNDRAIGMYKSYGFKIVRESNWITKKKYLMQKILN